MAKKGERVPYKPRPRRQPESGHTTRKGAAKFLGENERAVTKLCKRGLLEFRMTAGGKGSEYRIAMYGERGLLSLTARLAAANGGPPVASVQPTEEGRQSVCALPPRFTDAVIWRQSRRVETIEDDA